MKFFQTHSVSLNFYLGHRYFAPHLREKKTAQKDEGLV